MPNLPWTFWSHYPKVHIGIREYAVVGERFYTRHAIEGTLPSGRRTITGVEKADKEGGGYSYHQNARSIAQHEFARF